MRGSFFLKNGGKNKTLCNITGSGSAVVVLEEMAVSVALPYHYGYIAGVSREQVQLEHRKQWNIEKADVLRQAHLVAKLSGRSDVSLCTTTSRTARATYCEYGKLNVGHASSYPGSR